MESVHAATRCQQCNSKLIVSGLEDLSKESSVAYRNSGLRSMMGSTVGGGRLDESFVVLDPSKNRKLNLHKKTVEESFLIVGGTVVAGRIDSSADHLSLPQGISKHNVDERFQQLATVLEIASGETKAIKSEKLRPLDSDIHTPFEINEKIQRLQAVHGINPVLPSQCKSIYHSRIYKDVKVQVDQPLCLDCANAVRKEVEASIQELEAECKAYEEALEKLSKQSTRALPEQDFERECEAIEAEIRDAELKAKQAEQELEEAQGELGELRRQAQELEGLEKDYWHAANHLTNALQTHSSQTLSLQRKILRSEQHLKRLQSSNVYNDMFAIWFDGPFGTISGFRLGRTSNVPVEWDEINAAWGQAVLLLQTMAQACKLTFTGCRLLPMGSFPKVSDKRGTMELYGPVTKLYCANFDRAMISYLGCLKEFYEFAQGWDKAEGRTPLEMPYAIEGDMVGGQSIKYVFCKDSKWTLGLKYMLSDLKWALAWMVQRQKPSAKQNWTSSMASA